MPLLPPIIAELKVNASEFKAGLSEASDQMDEVGEKGATTGQKLKAGIGTGALAVGAALTGVGLALTNLGSKEQAAGQLLAQSFENAGIPIGQYKKQIDDAVKSNENFGISSADTKQALSQMISAGIPASQVFQDLATAVNVSKGAHLGLTQAVKGVIQATQGGGKLIKLYGIDLSAATKLTAANTLAQKDVITTENKLIASKLALQKAQLKVTDATKVTKADLQGVQTAEAAVQSATEAHNQAVRNAAFSQDVYSHSLTKGETAMAALAAKTKGDASAATDTFAGKIDAIKTKMEDWIAGPAAKIGPILTAMGPAMMAVGTIVESGLIPPFAELILQLGLILAPVLAVAAVAYVIYRNWGTISAFFEQVWGDVTRQFFAAWDAIKKAFQEAWNFITGVFDSAVSMIKSHLTLILAIFAPWLEAIIQIKDHWTQIWNDLKAGFDIVVGLIVGIAKDLINTALAPINFAVGLVQGVWSAAWNAVTGIVQGVWNILKGIFDQIISKVHDVTNAIGTVVSAPGKIGGAIGHAIGGIFDKGGYVPGQPGQAMLAVVHGGEYVNTRAQVAGGELGGSGGGLHIHEGAFQLQVAGGLDETVSPAVQDMIHRSIRQLAHTVRNR